MAYTSVIQAAQADMRRALADGRKPIIHILTDSYDDVLQICNQAFFEKEEGKKDSNLYSKNADNGRYIYLEELVGKHKEGWRLASADPKNPAAVPYVFGKYVLVYHPSDDGQFDSDVLKALNAYVNLKRTAQSQYPSGSRDRWPQSIVVLYGSRMKIPGDLDESVDFVKVGQMTREDISLVLKKHLDARGKGDEYGALAADATLIEFYHQHFSPHSEAFMLDMLDKIAYGPEWLRLLYDKAHAQKIIHEHKISLLRSHDLLEWIDLEDEPILDEASYEYKWIMRRKALITSAPGDPSSESEGPRIKGEPTIKGMLLLGGPGTGKSRAAKGVAQCLGMPLFRLTMSRILDSYVGNSDKNLDQALKDLSSVGHATLWIDEIEKALGGGSKGAGSAMKGAGGSKGTDGLMDRLNGQLLTFQQEAKQPVFIIATANSVENLLPEMFRNGRYDVRIAKMMPNFKECCDIMDSMLKSKLGIRSRSLAEYYVKISSILDSQENSRPLPQFLTGADIEALIKALRAYLDLPRNTHYMPKDGFKLDAEDEKAIMKAMRLASEDVIATVDASSPNTVDRIAASYVATFGEGTIQGGSNPVIDKKHYNRNAVLDAGKDDKEATCMMYTKEELEAKKKCPYDWAMYEHITKAMDRCLRRQQ